MAGVDPALVIHYFGSKDALFAEVLQLPVRPREVFTRAAAAEPGRIGETVARAFLEAWEPPEQRVRLTAMLRSATTNETAMQILRELLVREVFAPMTQMLAVPDGELRATLVGSQFVGPGADALRRRHRAAGVGEHRRAGRGRSGRRCSGT